MSASAEQTIPTPEAPTPPVLRTVSPVESDGGLLFHCTPTPWTGAYGGDLMAHCTAAGRWGRPLGRLVSASYEFLSAVDPHRPVEARSTVIRSGRSITHVQVELAQGGQSRLSAVLVHETAEAEEFSTGPWTSLGTQADAGTRTGGTAQATRGTQAGAGASAGQRPQEIPAVTDSDLAHLPGDFHDYYSRTRGLDVRYLSKPPFAAAPGARLEPISLNWTRLVEAGEPGGGFSEAALAFISDDAALEPVLNSTGISWLDPGAELVTLSHDIHFGAPLRQGSWVRCENRLVMSSGRYVETHGVMSDESGTVLATTRQLGIRVGSA